MFVVTLTEEGFTVDGVKNDSNGCEYGGFDDGIGRGLVPGETRNFTSVNDNSLSVTVADFGGREGSSGWLVV